MSKYIVIGNPIEHSLSPKLHNFWMKKNNINSVYEKKLIEEDQIKGLILELRNNKLDGINVTVPFKHVIIPFLDGLTPEADETKSVNTIFKDNEKVIGHNTDIGGFELGLRHIKYNTIGKKVMDALKELDKIAYIRFASVYTNFKEVGEFEEVIEELHGKSKK